MRIPRNTIRVSAIWLLALAASSSTSSVAQNPYVQVQGPTYSWSELREREIEGVRFSMTPKQAIQVLEARGFVPDGNTYETGVRFVRLERREDLSLTFTTRGKPAIRAITYSRSIRNDELTDIAFWRDEVLRLLGATPTSWEQHVDTPIYGRAAPLVIRDRFTYSTEIDTEERESARSCMYRWECKSRAEDSECRQKVENLRGGWIHGAFVYEGLFIWAENDELSAAQLLADPAYREHDLAKACLAPSVH